MGSASLDENAISKIVIGAAIEVHRELGGPGLLEAVYEEALAFELRESGLEVERQKTFPLRYKGETLDHQLRLDLLVESKVVVGCKATTLYSSVFEAQVLTYLRQLDLRLGLVIKFGQGLVKRGIRTVVNNLEE